MEPSSSASAGTTSSSSPSSSHRRELQGPRPAPLRVRRDSHKIRRNPPPPPQVREPVIIYTVSPKVVHAEPSEFMSVVQRLTGGTATAAAAASSSSSVPAAAPPHHQIQTSSSPLLPFPFFGGGGAPSSSSAAALQLQYPAPAPAPHFPFQLPQHQPGGPQEMMTTTTELSPAARLAAIEQAGRMSSGGSAGGGGLLMPPFPGILSPGSLPAIQPSFFSPPPPGAGINLFGELISPAAAFLGAGTAAGTTHAAGYQNVMPLQQEASPSAGGASYYWGDLFNNPHYHQN